MYNQHEWYNINPFLADSPNIRTIARNRLLIYFSLLVLLFFLSANALLISLTAMKQPMQSINMPKLSKSVLISLVFAKSFWIVKKLRLSSSFGIQLFSLHLFCHKFPVLYKSQLGRRLRLLMYATHGRFNIIAKVHGNTIL